MGQKIHPVGFRVGVIRGFDSHWYENKKNYHKSLLQDHQIREYIKNKIGKGIISRIEIERAANRIKATIFTSRPGAVIGKKGEGINELSDTLNRKVRKLDKTMAVQVNVTEVRQPELDAQLVAENIAVQLEKRVSHRRAMRQAMTRAVRMNGRGIKVHVSGRLNGAEIARNEQDKVGKIPLHTLRADIDYGVTFAHTIYGSVGVKVWIYRGEVLPEKRIDKNRARDAEAEAPVKAKKESAPAAAEAAPEVPVLKSEAEPKAAPAETTNPAGSEE
ncbi:MAG: 30S ribosomal protein S3 [Fimbriimonadaceae bacterium]|nr:30S ribosomal protein S3 [Fimbriimonadaceae bacterium]